MSENNSSSGGGCGCGGCISIVLFILLFWAIWYGLPIGNKTWNIDIFPPRIWDMSETQNDPVTNSVSPTPVSGEINSDSTVTSW